MATDDLDRNAPANQALGKTYGMKALPLEPRPRVPIQTGDDPGPADVFDHDERSIRTTPSPSNTCEKADLTFRPGSNVNSSKPVAGNTIMWRGRQQRPRTRQAHPAIQPRRTPPTNIAALFREGELSWRGQSGRCQCGGMPYDSKKLMITIPADDTALPFAATLPERTRFAGFLSILMAAFAAGQPFST